MLSRLHRIVKEKDFNFVLRKGKGWRVPEMQIKILVNALPHNRFGIVVSNKVAKKANVRNLLKRRLREILRAKMPGLRTGFDVVLISNPAAIERDFSQLDGIVDFLFYKMFLKKNV